MAHGEVRINCQEKSEDTGEADLVVISRASKLHFLVAVKDEVNDGVAVWYCVAPAESGAELV